VAAIILTGMVAVNYTSGTPYITGMNKNSSQTAGKSDRRLYSKRGMLYSKQERQ
jgi:hypothetical protein